MKTWKAPLLAAAALACAPLAGGGARAQSFHVSPEGGACVHFDGITYDAPSQYYTAHWTNICGYSIRVNYSRVDPASGQRYDNYAWVSGGSRESPGKGSALLLLSDRMDWSEQM